MAKRSGRWIAVARRAQWHAAQTEGSRIRDIAVPDSPTCRHMPEPSISLSTFATSAISVTSIFASLVKSARSDLQGSAGKYQGGPRN